MPKKLLTTRIKPVRSKIKPIVKTSISDDIVDQILSLIAKGDLKPGQRLPSERELCKDFGAGRSSLREALRCLSIVGVLNARVGEGTSVAPNGGKFLGKIVEWRIMTERHDIEDLMQVRIALESVAAASVARQGNEEDFSRLELLLIKMEAARNNEKRFAALDLEFHVSLAAASKNFLIFDLISMIRGQMEKTLSRVLLVPNALPLSLKEHISIVNAITRRDPDAASKAMQHHLDAALKRYQNALGDEHTPITDSRSRKISGSSSKATEKKAKAKA
jgi:GntR family transcriptional repressor for pyruvate dehydrogenase complex